ncbi:hypothetical protein M4A92_15695 [Caldibacillus thermoamylovorans]|uniref:hypothetical protein n=1 Tax=Caldibacillus thermoamylovorans TaxID=35841 RepID=UPI00203E291A|nr:hypothetical protein [Caldibacillus thermoamylovorans]MCM3800038.1 hypothetical protein [Caldibacillus thermoamylovorans]
MTLVLTANISGYFTIMTSDFREVAVTYDKNELLFGNAVVKEKDIVKKDEKNKKVFRLNKYVLIAEGGDVNTAFYLINLMKQKIQKEYDLADCIKTLRTIVDQETAHLPFLRLEWGVTIMLAGYYRDGTCGNAVLVSGKKPVVIEMKNSKGTYGYNAIVPVKKYGEVLGELFKISEPDKVCPNTLFQQIANQLRVIHGVVSYNHPVDVSSEFEMHVITQNDRGELEYQVMEFNSTGLHELLDNKSRVL